MGADHREYWFAMTGWSLRPEFKPQAGADGPEAMQKQLYNLAFWYWAYDRICELGHDGSVQLSVLRGEWFAQFGVVGDQLCETFEQLLETQRKLKRMYVHREHVRVTKWQQHKLKGLRPIEQLIQERNRKRLERKRDTDVTETGQSHDPRARAPTPTPTPTPTPDTDTENTNDASVKPRIASDEKFIFPEAIAKELKEHWQFYRDTLHFNASAWATRALKECAPVDEIAHVLRRMAIASVADKIKNPWPWASKTLAELTKNTEFEERLKEHEDLKHKDFVTAGDVLASVKAKEA